MTTGPNATRYVVIVCSLLLSSCALIPGIGKSSKSEHRLFILNPEAMTAQPVDAVCGDIQIGDLMTAPGYRGSRMLYSVSPHEIEHYARTQWADNVGRLLALPLKNGIVASGKFKNVLASTSIAPTDHRLEIADLKLIQKFEHREALNSVVQMDFTAYLISLKPTYSQASQHFSASKTTGPNPQEGVRATNQLAAQLIEELSEFVAKNCQLISEQ